MNNNFKKLGLGILLSCAMVFVLTGCGSKSLPTTPSDVGNTPTTVTPVTNTSAYKVKFKNFIFSVPDNMVYQVTGDVLLLGDETDSWVSQVEVIDGSFNQLKSNMSSLQSSVQQQGITAKPAQLKTIAGYEVITIEMSNGVNNAIVAFVKINSMYISGITLINQSNDYDYSSLEKVVPIVANAQYSDSTNSIAMNPALNFDKTSLYELAK